MAPTASDGPGRTDAAVPGPVPEAARSSIMAALRDLPGWDALDPGSIVLLAGGLSTQNYKVTGASGSVVVRFTGARSPLLGLDPDTEARNAAAAGLSGVAPAVITHQAAEGITVSQWVQGEILTDARLREPETVRRVAAVCRRMHAGAPFVDDFDLFAARDRYLTVVRSRGLTLPEGYFELAGMAAEVTEVLARCPLPTVPCHNDLVANNMLDDGQRLWLIDFEYAANNDPYFDLGNLWSEAGLEPGHLDTLITAYLGRASPPLTARARLWGALGQYTWALWAAIQSDASAVDFDFAAWGQLKFNRARRELGSAELPELLAAVQRSSR